MKSLVLLFVLVITGNNACGMPGGPGSRHDELFGNEVNSDPLTGLKYRFAIKVNTLQVLFCEAPVAFEMFGRNNKSLQVHAGIIFPLEDDSFLQDFFRSSGDNGTASEKGLFSYRVSPYNNHGLSFRYEFRTYVNGYYIGPQVTYKFLNYDDASFHVFSEGELITRKESKFSRIFGLGLMAGRQTYFGRQVTDFYAGIGLRYRTMDIDITSPENENKSIRSYYPFFNIGFRTGIVLH